MNGQATTSVPYLRVANVQDGYLDLSEIKTIEATPADLEKCALVPGDLLMTEGGDPDKLGRCAMLLHGEVEGLYRVLRARAEADEGLRESLSAFDNAWERHSADWSQINAKDVIRTASLFAESALVSASNNRANDFNRALDRLRLENRFPSNELGSIRR